MSVFTKHKYVKVVQQKLKFRLPFLFFFFRLIVPEYFCIYVLINTVMQKSEFK